MKNKFTLIIIVSALIFNSGCEKIFLKPEPKKDDLSVLDEYWTTVNERYAMLDFKGVNWKMVKDTIKPKLESGKIDLFTALSEMVTTLRDAHSYIADGENQGGWMDLYNGYQRNFKKDILFNNYLNSGVTTITETAIYYKTLPDNIGYIHIPEFDNFETDDIEKVINDLKDTKGMIIDVRENLGGDPGLAADLASHFTDIEVYTGFERFKTGPGLNDFSDSKINLLPTKDTYYDKPVAILTNRGCYSATTTLIYLMNPLSQVTLIGDKTGGGSGSVAEGYLGNGWIWSLSTSEFIDYQEKHLDDGYDPDIFVTLDTIDVSKDEIIERAILELQ